MATNVAKSSFMFTLLECGILWGIYAIIAVHSVLYIFAFFLFIWGWSRWAKKTHNLSQFWMRGAAFLFLLAGTQKTIVYAGGPSLDLVEWGAWLLTVVIFALPLWFSFGIQKKLGYLSHDQLFALAQLGKKTDISSQLNSLYKAYAGIYSTDTTDVTDATGSTDFTAETGDKENSTLAFSTAKSGTAEDLTQAIFSTESGDTADSALAFSTAETGTAEDLTQSIFSTESGDTADSALAFSTAKSGTAEDLTQSIFSTESGDTADSALAFSTAEGGTAGSMQGLSAKEVEHIKKYMLFCAFITDINVRQGINALSVSGFLLFFYVTFDITYWIFAGIGIFLLFGLAKIAQGARNLGSEN